MRFKALADRKKHIYDEDIEALVDEEIAHAHDRIKLVSLTVIAGTMGRSRATADARHRRPASRPMQSTGNGPVDAIFNCIKALVPHEAKLELYQVHAVTEGTDAQAEVSVRLAESGRSVTAQGRRSRYAGGLRQGLSRRAQQADDQAPARRGRVRRRGGCIRPTWRKAYPRVMARMIAPSPLAGEGSRSGSTTTDE